MSQTERDMMVEQRNMLLSYLATFYPNARSGESYFLAMLGPFPEYTRRLCMRDLNYLLERGYAVRRGPGARKPDPGTPWNKAMWAATAEGLDVSKRIIEDPRLEL